MLTHRIVKRKVPWLGVKVISVALVGASILFSLEKLEVRCRC